MTDPKADTGARSEGAAGAPKGMARRIAGLRGRGSWIRFGVSIALIVLILRHASLAEIGEALGDSLERYPYLLIALALPGTGILISSLRWKALLGGVSVYPSTFGLAQAMLVASFFNFFLPSTIGGDIARSWWISKVMGSATLSLTVVGVDRFMGLLGICTVGLIAAAMRPSLISGIPHIWLAAAVIGLAVLPVLALGHSRVTAAGRKVLSLPGLRAIRDKAVVIYQGILSIRRSKRRLVAAFLLSIALQCNVIAAFFLLALAIGIDLTLWEFALLIPIVSVVTMIPVAINGIGLREVSLAVLGAGLGMSAYDAVALAWLFMALQMVYGIAGGLVYAVCRPRTA